MNYRASSTLPSGPAPTGEDWLPISLDGQWYWDGTRWLRTVESPWSSPRRDAGRHERRRALAPILVAPFVLLALLGAQVLGRALAAAVRVAVGVFAVGAVVAVLVFLLAAILHG